MTGVGLYTGDVHAGVHAGVHASHSGRQVDVCRDGANLARLGVPVLTMLRGDEPYKRKWRPVPVHNERLILGRAPAASLYAAAARCHARLSATRKHHFAHAGPNHG